MSALVRGYAAGMTHLQAGAVVVELGVVALAALVDLLNGWRRRPPTP